jgi:electron transfer flavoprotein beta subunit
VEQDVRPKTADPREERTLKIVVCVKQVPDTTEVKIDPKTNTLMRQGVPSIVNPHDKHALEMALSLRDQLGGSVTVLSMGPMQSQEALRECLAMGADHAVLLSDRAFGGADTLATSYTLAAGIRKIGEFDLIICGKQAIDGDTAQVGPEMAEHLGIPHITYASQVEAGADGAPVRVHRDGEEGTEILEVKLPVLLTVTHYGDGPRLPVVKGIRRAFRAEVDVWSVNDVEVDRNVLGLKGSPTQVRRIFSPDKRCGCEMIPGDACAAASVVATKLRELRIIGVGS